MEKFFDYCEFIYQIYPFKSKGPATRQPFYAFKVVYEPMASLSLENTLKAFSENI